MVAFNIVKQFVWYRLHWCLQCNMQAGQQRWRDPPAGWPGAGFGSNLQAPGGNNIGQRGGDAFPLNNPNNEKASHHIPVPGWSAEHSAAYNLKRWRQEVVIWQMGGKHPEADQGVQLFNAIRGIAQEKLRMYFEHIGWEHIRSCRDTSVINDPDGFFPIDQGLNGVDIIVKQLFKTWGPDEQTMSIAYVAEFFYLRWKPGELIESFLMRLDMVYQRAHDFGGLEINALGRSYLLKNYLHLRDDDMVWCLKNLNNRFPTDDAQYQQFRQDTLAYLRIKRPHMFVPSRVKVLHAYEEGQLDISHLPFDSSDSRYVKVFHIDGEEISQDPNECYSRIQQEAEQLRLHPDFVPVNYSNFPTSSVSDGHPIDQHLDAFVTRAQDEADHGPPPNDDSDVDSPCDMSEISTQSGLGSPCDEITPEENAEAQEAYYQKRRATRHFRKFQPKGYKHGFRKKTTKGRFFGKRSTGFRKGRRGFKRSAFNASFKKHNLKNGLKNKAFSRGGTNPLGRDGKPMTCTTCNSIHHFRAECDNSGPGVNVHLARKGKGKGKFKGKGKGKGKEKSKAFHSAEDVAHIESYYDSDYAAEYAVAMDGTEGLYYDQGVHHVSEPLNVFGGTEVIAEELTFFSCETRVDGDHFSTMPVTGDVPVSPVPQHESDGTQENTWLGYEHIESNSDVRNTGTAQKEHIFFGKQDRISKGEALLLDTGAWKNIVGSGWVDRMDQVNQQNGKAKSIREPLGYTVSLGGVGQNSQQSKTKTTVPITVNGSASSFSATVIEGSNLPALLGLKTLKQKNAVLDIRNNRLLFPKSAKDIQLSFDPKNVTVLNLEQAPGGYLMVPCSPDTAR